MRITAIFSRLLILAGFSLALSACRKSDADSGPPQYDRLGTVSMYYISGFTFEGDPMGLGADSLLYHFNRNTGDWEKMISPSFTGALRRLQPVCQDADGIFYARTTNSLDFYQLKPGDLQWERVSLPGPNSGGLSFRGLPATSRYGDVAIVATLGRISRLYRKTAHGNWSVMHEWQTDGSWEARTMDDAGNVYVKSYQHTYTGPEFIPAAGNESRQMTDCNAGSALTGYCQGSFAVSQSGEAIYYDGNRTSDQMYRQAGGTAYPATAEPWVKLPSVETVFQEFFQLRDGTTIGLGGSCYLCLDALYIRKGDSKSWYADKSVPVLKYGHLAANVRDELYCWEPSYSGGSGAGRVYRIRF